jgi:mannosyltransferase
MPQPSRSRAPGPRAGDVRWRRWHLAVGVELILGAVLCVILLGAHSLWLDESVSATLATVPWHQFATVVAHREPNMGLYYLLLRVWVVFGHGETALRSFSVLAEVAGLGVVIMLARDLFGQRAALVCGVLLAVDPLVVEFAQDVRGYALCLLLVSASSLLFVRGIQKPDSRPWLTWAGYTLVSVAGAYTNFWAVLVPLSHALSLGFLPRRRIPVRRLVPVAGAMCILLVPLALLIRATDSAGVNWAAGSSAGHLITRIRSTVPHPVLDAGAVLVVVVLVVAIILARRRPAAMAVLDAQWAWLFAVSWLVVPLGAVIVLSLTYKPLLVIRYLMVCVPPAALLLGALVARAAGRQQQSGRFRPLAGVVLAGMLAVSLLGTIWWYRSSGPQDWRDTVAYVGDQSRPGDGVIFVAPYVRIPFEWYVVQHPEWSANVRPVYPSLGWGKNPLRFDSNVTLGEGAVAQAARSYSRVWLVLCDQQFAPQQYRAVTAALRHDGFRTTRTRSFKGVVVVEETRLGTA